MRMLQIALNLNPAVNWDVENLGWGYANTLLWTNVDPLVVCAGGVIDSEGRHSDPEQWRPGYICANTGGNCPASKNSAYYFGNPVTSSRASSATINNMEIETDFDAGERWLFGTTRGLESPNYASQTYFFKVKLNSAEASMDGASANMKKINGLTEPAYVATVRNKWDVSGKMHYILYNNDGGS